MGEKAGSLVDFGHLTAPPSPVSPTHHGPTARAEGRLAPREGIALPAFVGLLQRGEQKNLDVGAWCTEPELSWWGSPQGRGAGTHAVWGKFEKVAPFLGLGRPGGLRLPSAFAGRPLCSKNRRLLDNVSQRRWGC